MKSEVIKNSFFKNIQTLICNQFDFSFTVDQNLAFEISYNKGTGTAKAILEGMEYAHEFISDLIGHENCKSHEVNPKFWEVIKPEQTRAKDYKKLKGCVYINGDTYERINGVIDYTNTNVKKVDVFESEKLPGILLVKGKDIWASVLHRDYAFYVDRFEGAKDKIQAAIDLICERFIDKDELFEYLELRRDSQHVQAWRDAERAKEAVENEGSAVLYIETEKQGKGKAKKEGKNEAKNGSKNDFAERAISKALQAKEYEVLNKAIFFNQDFEIVDVNKAKETDLLCGARLVKCNDFENIMLASHKRINGSTVSLVYKGLLYEFDDMTAGGDQIQKAIDLIKLKGLETILAMAENGLQAA